MIEIPNVSTRNIISECFNGSNCSTTGLGTPIRLRCCWKLSSGVSLSDAPKLWSWVCPDADAIKETTYLSTVIVLLLTTVLHNEQFTIHFFGIYTCRSWSHWICVPSSKWILATQALINRNSELGNNDDWHNLPRKWNQEKMVNDREGIYIISIILTWCIDESSSNESSVHNSVTVAGWRSMNVERLLAVLKIDLKYQLMVNQETGLKNL